MLQIYVGLGLCTQPIEEELYHISYGMLLRIDLHHAYDRYRLSFFVQMSDADLTSVSGTISHGYL